MKRGVEDTGHGMWDTKENLSQERHLVISLPLFPRWEMIFLLTPQAKPALGMG